MTTSSLVGLELDGWAGSVIAQTSEFAAAIGSGGSSRRPNIIVVCPSCFLLLLEFYLNS